MTRMIMADGQIAHLHPADVALNSYRVQTLAHHIALINRFNGGTCRPYSVAEHSLLCADIAEGAYMPARTQLACLVHDLHEAFVGDMSTPLKRVVGALWAGFERRHQGAMLRALGLEWFWRHAREVHQCDLTALATERRDLLNWPGASVQPWSVLDQPGAGIEPVDTNLMREWRVHMTWSEWRDLWLQRYTALRQRIAEEEAAPIATSQATSQEGNAHEPHCFRA